MSDKRVDTSSSRPTVDDDTLDPLPVELEPPSVRRVDSVPVGDPDLGIEALVVAKRAAEAEAVQALADYEVMVRELEDLRFDLSLLVVDEKRAETVKAIGGTEAVEDWQKAVRAVDDCRQKVALQNRRVQDAFVNATEKSIFFQVKQAKMLGYGRHAIAHFAGEGTDKKDLAQMLKYLKIAREGSLKDFTSEVPRVVFVVDAIGPDGNFLPNLPFPASVLDSFLLDAIDDSSPESAQAGMLVGSYECEIEGENAPAKLRLCFIFPYDLLGFPETLRDEDSKTKMKTVDDGDLFDVPYSPPSRTRFDALLDPDEVASTEDPFIEPDPPKAETSSAVQGEVRRSLSSAEFF